jgi:hypothetical protein
MAAPLFARVIWVEYNKTYEEENSTKLLGSIQI